METYRYTDAQAIADGHLIRTDYVTALQRIGIERVTRNLFDWFERSSGVDGLIICAVTVVQTGHRDGNWTFGNWQGSVIWLVPNELGSLTMMFPEDY